MLGKKANKLQVISRNKTLSSRYPDVDDSNLRRTYLGMVSHMDDLVGNVTATLESLDMYDNSIVVMMGDNGGYQVLHAKGNKHIFGEEWLLKFFLLIQDRETFTADVGFPASGSNFPLRGQKGEYYEGGVRVPSFVHSPLLSRVG